MHSHFGTKRSIVTIVTSFRSKNYFIFASCISWVMSETRLDRLWRDALSCWGLIQFRLSYKSKSCEILSAIIYCLHIYYLFVSYYYSIHVEAI